VGCGDSAPRKAPGPAGGRERSGAAAATRPQAVIARLRAAQPAVRLSRTDAPRFIWKRRLDRLYAVVGGIGLASGHGYVRAYDLDKGMERWKFTIPKEARYPARGKGCPFGAYVTVRSGVVYFGSCAGTVHAVGLRTGRKLWSADISDYPIWTAPIVIGDTVLTGGVNTFAALNRRTGRLLWKVRARRVTSVASQPGIVILGGSARLTALSAGTGRSIWTIKRDAMGLAVLGRRIYECGPDPSGTSYLRVRSVADGKVVKRFEVRCDDLVVTDRATSGRAS
jgi:hypothetical protein